MPELHGKCRTPEYTCWGGMLNRCHNPSQNGHVYLQGSGVTVCAAWLVFENFYADMGDKPDPDMVLTRIDPDGDFCPANCIWAAPGVGQHNDKLRSNNTTGVKGVYRTSRGKWQAAITIEAKRKHLGTYDTIGEAAAKRREAEEQYWRLA